MSNGPILKDWQYFLFWSVALMTYASLQIRVILLLMAILREVRK